MTRDASVKLQTQQKLAELVDQYNRLNEEQRFEEAEVIAKRAQELAPHEMVTQVMVSKSSIMRQTGPRPADQGKERRWLCRRHASTSTRLPYPHRRALRLARRQELARHDRPAGQRRAMEMNRRHRNEKEIEIEKKLLTPVNYSCRNRPLSEVLNQLAKLVNVNIHLDDEGLREEGLLARYARHAGTGQRHPVEELSQPDPGETSPLLHHQE